MTREEPVPRAVVGPRGNVRRNAGALELDVEKSDLGSLRVVVRSGGGATTATLWSERSRSTESAITGSSLELLGGLGLAANAPGAAAMTVAGVAGMAALLPAGTGLGLGVAPALFRAAAPVRVTRPCGAIARPRDPGHERSFPATGRTPS